MNKENTGKLIKEARLQKNYTQSELGALLGVTNKAISRWETGESFPDIGLLEAISQILDIPIEDIIIGEKQQNEEGNALKEAVRIAKIQQELHKQKYSYQIIVNILLLGILLILGYTNFNSISGNKSNDIIEIFLFVIAILKIISTKQSIFPSQKSGNRKVMYASLTIFLFVCFLFSSFVYLISIGSSLINYSIGPIVNALLLLAFVLLTILLIYDFFMNYKYSNPIQIEILCIITSLVLTVELGNLLHRLDSLDTLIYHISIQLLILLIEFMLSVGICFFFKRKR